MNKKLVLVGNCQIEYISKVISNSISSGVEVYQAPPVHLITKPEVEDLHEKVRECDFLITQPISDDFRDNLGVGTNALKAISAETSKTLRIPNFYYSADFTTFGYLYDALGNAIRGNSSLWGGERLPWGDYHDYFILISVLNGDCFQDFADRLKSTRLPALKEKLENQSLEELRNRDVSCDIKSSEVLGSVKSLEGMFHSFNHPSNKLMENLAFSILEYISIPYLPRRSDDEFLGQPKLPIYPFLCIDPNNEVCIDDLKHVYEIYSKVYTDQAVVFSLKNNFTSSHYCRVLDIFQGVSHV